MTYLLEQGWSKERARLEALARLFDPGTKRQMHDVGIADGWRVLEVGAGTGTLAAWLREQTGSGGQVVFTDLDVRHLGAAADLGVRVLQHDILSGPPEAGAFDLVHARAVVEWIGDRQTALEAMVAALTPGGWLIVEDVDFITAGCAYPESILKQRVASALATLASLGGAELNLGRQLVALLDQAGLEDVSAEGRVPVQRNGDASCDYQVLTIEQVGEALVKAGLLSPEQVDEIQVELSTRGTGVGFPPMMVAVRGRRPAEAGAAGASASGIP